MLSWSGHAAVKLSHPLPDKYSTVLSAEEKELLDLTNHKRIKKGLNPLKVNKHLMGTARKHSERMSRHHRLTHLIKGKNFLYRLRRAGYPGNKAGENVGRSKRGPERVIHLWMKSPNHRVNILNAQFKDIGIGISTASNGEKFYTQVFGAQRWGQLLNAMAIQDMVKHNMFIKI